MKPELSRHLGRLKIPIMLRMRYYKGPYELVNWWEHFIHSIPKDAGFEDLDQKTRELILS